MRASEHEELIPGLWSLFSLKLCRACAYCRTNSDLRQVHDRILMFAHEPLDRFITCGTYKLDAHGRTGDYGSICSDWQTYCRCLLNSLSRLRGIRLQLNRPFTEDPRRTPGTSLGFALSECTRFGRFLQLPEQSKSHVSAADLEKTTTGKPKRSSGASLSFALSQCFIWYFDNQDLHQSTDRPVRYARSF